MLENTKDTKGLMLKTKGTNGSMSELRRKQLITTNKYSTMTTYKGNKYTHIFQPTLMLTSNPNESLYHAKIIDVEVQGT